jgi:hypothetical protein
MGYDLTQIPVLRAQLAAMADDRQFLLESAATFWRATPTGRFPAALSLAPVAAEEGVMVAYRVQYRRLVWRGHIVVGPANVPIAQLLLAQDALFQLQQYERDHPPQYLPGGPGVKAGP